MSSLFLVRHGQASFLEEDYDRLSPLGQAQGRQLGAFWASRGLAPDAVFVGPRSRHADTLEACAGAFAAAGGRAFPPATMLPELDEHGADALLKAHLPELSARHPEIARLAAEAAAALAPSPGEPGDAPAPRMARWRAVSRLLDATFRLWGEGLAGGEGVETFVSFRKRIARAVAQMREGEGKGRTVLAFTSGGVVGAAVGEALRCDDRAALDLGLMSHNASFTELVWSGPRISLATFNATPHLADSGARTYR
jgi:broad specificity phosphatase PhoE